MLSGRYNIQQNKRCSSAARCARCARCARGVICHRISAARCARGIL